jgi:hypothetical protein
MFWIELYVNYVLVTCISYVTMLLYYAYVNY